MADVNCVILIGRLTQDSDLKYTNTAQPVVNGTLAVNFRKKDGDRSFDEASFFSFTLWGRLGELLHPYLVKGKQIAITGELRQQRWVRDDHHYSKIYILAEDIQLLSSPAGSNQQGNAYRNYDSGRGQPRAVEPPPAAYPQEAPVQYSFEEDIPF